MRPLSAEEQALWTRLVATVRPLTPGGGQAVAPPAVPAPAPPAPMRAAPRGAAARPAAAPPRTVSPAPPPPPNTLDGSWDRKLARGLVVPDLAVDLHGHSLDGAYRVLDAGLAEAIARGARVLLLVTGRPRAPGSGRGAIRAAVGDWLAASRHAGAIAAVRTAHPRHGGAGALYIVLRRPRGSRIS
ncbi:DNA mismatch repair protein MutS [Sphingomonas changnyeongensis]|uniref:DNA mismatch repair protein MutS n=1 Tax=Sphingomonas changnyeongensis TaxID=2698679 RepID=A0A7Z2NX81_9SPHN|nr:Smr/MutS family protein [Sphingomonas changnyeongensis]QHL91491.1 DNA mismatch repair protein MutS [Sphingomonas changnyeongensis]